MTEPIEIPKKAPAKAPADLTAAKIKPDQVNYEFDEDKRELAAEVEKGQTKDSLAAHAEDVEAKKLEAEFEKTIKKELKKPGQTPKSVFEGLQREISLLPDGEKTQKILAKLEGKYLDQSQV